MICRLFTYAKMAIFFAAAISLFAALMLFWIPQRQEKQDLLNYNQFLLSLRGKTLPKSFVSHRKIDREFLKSVSLLLSHAPDSTAIEGYNNDACVGQSYAIPRIIHQLWLFDQPIPPEVSYAMSTMRSQNPSFTYILWTKEKVAERLRTYFGAHASSLFDMLSVSDYIAADILEEMGGIVVDPWVEAVAAFEKMIVPQADVVIGVEPPLANIDFGRRRIYASPALIGARPSNPLITLWKKELYLRLKTLFLPVYEGWSSKSSYERMIWTSLDSLTDTIGSYAKTAYDGSERVVFIGPTWWCPISPKSILKYHRYVAGSLSRTSLQKVKDFLGIGVPPFYSLYPESVSVHLAGGRIGLTAKRAKKIFEHSPYSLKI